MQTTRVTPDPAVLGDIQELDATWLASALNQPVSDFSSEQIVGEGYASRMYRLTVHRGEDDAPLRLILKLATDNETQREIIDASTMFREVIFYRDFSAPLVPLNVLPKIHQAAMDLERLQLTILMEDIGDIPHKPFLEDLPNSLAAVSVLAQVHAAYWEADCLARPELTPIESEVILSELEDLLAENLAAEASATYSFPYLRDCMLHLQKLAKWVISDADHFSGPMTLAHGDFHARNIFFGNDRTVLFDWQVTERGRPARDLAYWILTSVAVEDAEKFQPLLIERYLEVLHENGVSYSRKEFDKDFKDAAAQLVPRMFCYQTLIQLSDEDQHTLEDFLQRTDRMARELGLLNQLRIGRVIAPPMIFVLRLLGLRKPAKVS